MNNNTQTPELISDFVDGLLDDKRYCYVKNGVYYAPKAFVINALLNWCSRERMANNISRTEVIEKFKLIEKYLDGQIELKWKNGKVATINQSVA